MNKTITKAMVFAAGLGTRLKPFTDHHPKALYIINGKTLLERNILYLKEFGITDIIINVHHFAHQIIDFVEMNSSWGINISFSNEEDELLDTGGGLIKAAHYFNDVDDFILYNADILTDMPLNKMITYHTLHKPLVSLAVSERKSSRYLLFDDKDRLCGWENTLTGEQKIRIIKTEYIRRAFNGIHIVNKKLLQTRMELNKFSITDWYLDICKDQNILGYNSINTNFIDVGKLNNIVEAEHLFS